MTPVRNWGIIIGQLSIFFENRVGNASWMRGFAPNPEVFRLGFPMSKKERRLAVSLPFKPATTLGSVSTVALSSIAVKAIVDFLVWRRPILVYTVDATVPLKRSRLNWTFVANLFDLIPPRHNGKVERSHKEAQKLLHDTHSFYSLDDFGGKLAAHQRCTNNRPMRPVKRLSPKEARSSHRVHTAWQTYKKIAKCGIFLLTNRFKVGTIQFVTKTWSHGSVGRTRWLD